MKAKSSLVLATAGILFLLCVSAMLIPSSVRSNEDTSNVRTYWMNLASKAWEFYAPGQALNTQTGLYAASLDWPYFTEWDVGTQLQALLDARALGLLPDDGQWGFDNRVAKMLDFLKTRELTDNNVPYLLYDSRSGKHYQDSPTFSIDEGNLYLALNALSTVKPNLAQDINYIIKVRNNNTAIVPDPKTWLNSTDLYCYYIADAFKTLQFEGWSEVPSSILGTIISQPNITTYGVKLPSAHICSEPLIETLYEVKPQDSRFYWLASQIYLAQEARYNATGHYTAFSEGNTGFSDPSYIYEFVVDSDGAAWKIMPQITTPIAYTKVAYSFYACFNTTYTRNMVNYFENKLPTSTGGFQDGVDENGRAVYSHIDRTNKQIMSAARYVIENLPSDTSPTPTSTPPQSAATTLASTSSPSQPPDSSPSTETSPTPTSTFTSSTLTPEPQKKDAPSSNYFLFALASTPIIMIMVLVVLWLKKAKPLKNR